MATDDDTRLIAWARELRAVHTRLRNALATTRAALDAGEPAVAAGRDLLLFCHGFCVALTGHHVGEDRELFPAIAAQHPELRDVLRRLEQDHAMMAHLIAGLDAAVSASATPAELDAHVTGLAAIMENHFRYEEKQLLSVLETLDLDTDPRTALGPF